MKSLTTILLCEEDAATRAFLADNLTADGFEVYVAKDKAAALLALELRRPDLVICDVNGDTLGLLDAVRDGTGLAAQIDPDVPLIVLTRRADELARVRYLERGSDDVITKPLGYPELRSRVRAVLRRTTGRAPRGVTRVGTLHIDHVARTVHVGEVPVELSATEYGLLTHLAADPRRVCTKHELLRDVWGFRSPAKTRTLDSHACRLRHKLALAGDARFIENVWGVGYRLTRIDQGGEHGSAA
jgi:DNA-binding response OmpR family regulator